MRFLIIVGAVVCAAQAKQSVCEVGNPSGKCAPTQPNCQKGYECVDGHCCQAKKRLCPHNQNSHGLCDDKGHCPDPGHQCFTTDDDQRVCCNKNPPTPKQRGCLCGKPCGSSEDCQKSYECIKGSCCKNSDSGDSDSCPMGYNSNNLLGCYIIVEESSIITYDDAKQRCAKDGGALLLLNCREEAVELQKLLAEREYPGAIIQGSKSPGSSVWVTDDGIPLSYPTSVSDDTVNPYATGLVFIASGDFTALNLDESFMFSSIAIERAFIIQYVCEIEN